MRRIVILTGAGISAESGVPTFRDAGGLWEGHRVEDVATPEAFERNPELVQRFYNLRREAIQTKEPNAAHRAIAKLQQAWPGMITLVAQNIDDLHERGGSAEVIHMHGELLKSRCAACDGLQECLGEISASDTCPACGQTGMLRPHVVWFGEIPLYMEEIAAALQQADLFAAIGTSGVVYPAAGFVNHANQFGVPTIEFNLEETAASFAFDETRAGKAGDTVPAWVEELLR
ncbi:MAG TPA: NAD-dependent deacylase [Verrucomicrobiales bacterium]|nr:NAD-dependent deacylase [Verrucomicrobiales bacterium]